MKRVIDGVAYNTHTSTRLCRSSAGVFLYQSISGHFFIGDELKDEITPLSLEQAYDFYIKHGDLSHRFLIFDTPRPNRLLIRIPPALRAHLEDRAATAETSLNSLIIRLLERWT